MKLAKTLLLSFVVSLLISSFITIASGEQGNTLYVGQEKEYKKIQDAIDASENGDTILVDEGKYSENIMINKSINLIGARKETTIIDAKNNSNVVTIKENGVNISNFSLINAKYSGVQIESFFPGFCNISENIITECFYGIKIVGSVRNTFMNNIIYNNSGIGLDIENLLVPFVHKTELFFSTNNTIYQNDFFNNTQHVYDEGNNSWSFNDIGNYYDNYTGIDENNDSIGDIPYFIPGPELHYRDTIFFEYNITYGENIDEFPLMEPYNTINLTNLTEDEFTIDLDLVMRTMVIGFVIIIIFLIPISIYWRKKIFK